MKNSKRAELRKQFHLFIERYLDDLHFLTDGEAHNLTFEILCNSQFESMDDDLAFLRSVKTQTYIDSSPENCNQNLLPYLRATPHTSTRKQDVVIPPVIIEELSLQLKKIKSDLSTCNITNSTSIKGIQNLIDTSNVARNLMMDLLDLA